MASIVVNDSLAVAAKVISRRGNDVYKRDVTVTFSEI